MDGVPFFLSRVKADTPEDLLVHDLHFHTQTEPVDLSINKPRPSSSSTTPTTALSSSPLRYAFSPSSLSSSSSSSSSSPSVITSASSVLTSGPLVPPGSGVRGQPYLHILHSVPPPPSGPLSLPGAGKLASHVHRIPVVVQSLPLMYTSAVRSASSLNNAIMLPLLDEVKGQGKGGTTAEQNWPCIHVAWLGSYGLLSQHFPIEMLQFSNLVVRVYIVPMMKRLSRYVLLFCCDAFLINLLLNQTKVSKTYVHITMSFQVFPFKLDYNGGTYIHCVVSVIRLFQSHKRRNENVRLMLLCFNPSDEQSV